MRYRCTRGHEFGSKELQVECLFETKVLAPGMLPDCDGHCKAPIVFADVVTLGLLRELKALLLESSL